MSKSLPKALTPSELTQALKSRAHELGFGLVGVTPAARPDTLDHFRKWISEGYHGEMGYLERRESAYENSEQVMVGVRNFIVLGMNYGPGSFSADNYGRIAAYSQGTLDYHDVLREKIKQLAEDFRKMNPHARTRVAVDTAPVLERDVARRAGLGWFGKNTMLINRYAGSYFFLGAILTNAELEPDADHSTSHCGTCTRCLEACPTDAFVKPYVLDARKCVAYLTIELRDSMIPLDLRSGMEDWMFGCDVCQQVCPWNRKATSPTEPAFQPRDQEISSVRFLTMSESEFEQHFQKTPLSRPGWAVMARNAAITLGNSGSEKSIPVLVAALTHPHEMVRSAAAWGLGNFPTPDSLTVLLKMLESETHPDVREEVSAAIDSCRAKMNTEQGTPPQ